VVEFENREIARVIVSVISPFKTDFRQDIELQWKSLSPNSKASVVSAAEFYSRSPENAALLRQAMQATEKKQYERAISLMRQIVDADDSSRPLGPNQVGELIIQAPQLMTAYWDNPNETAEVLRQRPEGGTWLHTGDIGYADEDGYVYLVDRKKDLIKTSGFQVWPREIEEVLAAHPSVLEVAAAGVADAVKGEVVKAWIVLKEGTPASEDDLRRWCRERLAPYKVPARIEFRSELPKSLVGKVLRRALAGRQPA